MKKNKFYPLGGTTVFLVDQWAKHYVEKNLKMGEKRKLTEKLELRRIHNPGICLGVFANNPKKVKKLTEVGTGIVTVIQMLTLLGNSNILRKRVRVRGCHPLRPALPCRSAPQPDLRPGAAAPGCAALQPRRRNPCRVCPLDGLAIGPLSLAATRGVSRLISSPPGT